MTNAATVFASKKYPSSSGWHWSQLVSSQNRAQLDGIAGGVAGFGFSQDHQVFELTTPVLHRLRRMRVLLLGCELFPSNVKPEQLLAPAHNAIASSKV